MGIGRYDESNSDYQPIVVSISKGWGINRYCGIQAGAVVSPDYYSLGVNNSAKLTNNTLFTINTNIARDENRHKSGGLLATSLSYLASNSVSLSANSLIQSPDYHYLNDAVKNENNTNTKQKQFSGGFELVNGARNIGHISWANVYSR